MSTFSNEHLPSFSSGSEWNLTSEQQKFYESIADVRIRFLHVRRLFFENASKDYFHDMIQDLFKKTKNDDPLWKFDFILNELREYTKDFNFWKSLKQAENENSDSYYTNYSFLHEGIGHVTFEETIMRAFNDRYQMVSYSDLKFLYSIPAECERKWNDLNEKNVFYFILWTLFHHGESLIRERASKILYILDKFKVPRNEILNGLSNENSDD